MMNIFNLVSLILVIEQSFLCINKRKHLEIVYFYKFIILLMFENLHVSVQYLYTVCTGYMCMSINHKVYLQICASRSSNLNIIFLSN